MEEKVVEEKEAFPLYTDFSLSEPQGINIRVLLPKLLDKAQYHSCFVGRLSASSLANALQLSPRDSGEAILIQSPTIQFGFFIGALMSFLFWLLSHRPPETERPFEYMPRTSARPSMEGQYLSLFSSRIRR